MSSTPIDKKPRPAELHQPNTGLVGGGISEDAERTIVLSLSRMRQVRDVDLSNNSVTVEAGVILANLRALAEENDRMFPVYLGSAGSAQIGGLVSTNAGGTEVLRYGNMREQVLGLEVVLPDGRVLNALKGLRKDNSGYDLKHLFIGGEGTLGVVTAAVLKLWPASRNTATAMVAYPDVASATALLGRFYARVGSRVESFELMAREQIELVLKHTEGAVCPLPLAHQWYGIVALSDTAELFSLGDAMESVLAEAMAAGEGLDAVIAQDLTQAGKIWQLRHSISESNKREGFTIGNDTSVPVSRQPEFLRDVSAELKQAFPHCVLCHTGHLGDGNVHVVVVFPHGAFDPEDRETIGGEVNRIVHLRALAFGGSIAAEHGIGKMHVNRLAETKDPVALDVMRAVKMALDPEGRMNPGKVLRAD